MLVCSSGSEGRRYKLRPEGPGWVVSTPAGSPQKAGMEGLGAQRHLLQSAVHISGTGRGSQKWAWVETISILVPLIFIAAAPLASILYPPPYSFSLLVQKYPHSLSAHHNLQYEKGFYLALLKQPCDVGMGVCMLSCSVVTTLQPEGL